MKSINKRLCYSCIIFIIILFPMLFCLYKSFNIKEEKKIIFKEKSDLDYNVYLKDNKFYEEKFIPKDRLYVADLINNIVVDFSYVFDIEKDINMDFDYSVIAELVIKGEHDSGNSNTYYNKEYVLAEPENISYKAKKSFNVSKQIDIDYGYYNNLANQFRTEYGINSDSKLVIHFNINKTSKDDKIKMNDKKSSIVEIPLSERSISITLNYDDINESSFITEKRIIKFNFNKSFVIFIILSIINILVLCVIISYIVYKIKRTSKFDKNINKILKEYDRLIVETSYCPNIKDFTIIQTNSFTELLDVRDNLKLPIMFYRIKKDSCIFFIKNEKDLYILKYNKKDYENNEKNSD